MEYNYEGFVSALRQKLLLATRYEDSKICFKEAKEYPQSDGDRLLIKWEDTENISEVCAIHIREVYQCYLDGRTMERIVEDIMAQLEAVLDSGCFEKAKSLNSYDKIKPDLFIRLLNYEKHKEDLKGSVYRTIGDIALVLYADLGETTLGVTSVKIKNYMIKQWDEDIETIFEEALRNTYRMAPPRIYSWEKLLYLDDYSGESFMDTVDKDLVQKSQVGNCLSTTKRTNGAMSAFLPGVARRLADLIGGDFYLVFTSVHEVMIHSCEVVKTEDLKSVLKETIEETTPEEDFLTYEIYRYDCSSDMILMCSD